MSRFGNDAKVKEPYKQIKPLIRDVLQQKLPGNPNKKGPAAVFRPVSTLAMEQWLKANSPSAKSIQPGLNPLYGAAAKAAATQKPVSTADTSTR